MATTKECLTCKVVKSLTDFEGNRNDCKPCRAQRKQKSADSRKKPREEYALPERCRDPECEKPTPADGAVFTFRNDTLAGGYRATCNTCFNKKGYYKDYRKRKLEEDPDAYRARNAETHRDWTAANPDKVAKQKQLTATVPERKMKAIKSTAKAKGIAVEKSDEDRMKAQLTKACFYCDHLPGAGEQLNGVNRVDPEGGLTDANTVPSCGLCSNMKASSCTTSFVHSVRRVATHLGLDGDVEPDAPRIRPLAFGGYAARRAAPEKEKVMDLTPVQCTALQCAPCYLCGVTPACGIDRMDADGDYTVDNSRPCCAPCNYMKKDLSLDDFKGHIGTILRHTRSWVLPQNAQLFYGPSMRISQPIMVTNAQGRIVFPNSVTASKLVGMSKYNISKALSKGSRCMGCEWRPITASEYYDFKCTADAAASMIQSMRAMKRATK